MVVRRHGLLKILHQEMAFLAVLPRVELQRMHIEVNFWEFILYSYPGGHKYDNIGHLL